MASSASVSASTGPWFIKHDRQTTCPNAARSKCRAWVDHNGIQPTHAGAIPLQLAAFMQTNIHVQTLTVGAALTCNREHIFQAAIFDSHLVSELDLFPIRALMGDLLETHRDWLIEYH